MVTRTTAQETVFALRRKIARIEGTLAERLEVAVEKAQSEIVIRRQGVPDKCSLSTGIAGFDLAAGIPGAGLIELIGDGTKDSGSVAGFGLALACLVYKARKMPIIWIGTSDIFHEAGRPYAPGLLQRFAIPPHHVLIVEAGRIADMLWVAEEAASLGNLATVLVEIRGNNRKLDLTATRRLHRRALGAGYPVILLRQAGRTEPTAAPVRLIVSAAPAVQRSTLRGPVQGSIGPPAFHVTISKSRTAMPAAFTLEWNHDVCAFRERHASKDHVAVASAAAGRAGDEAAPWTVLASAPARGNAAAGLQPARKQHAANRNARQAS